MTKTFRLTVSYQPPWISDIPLIDKPFVKKYQKNFVGSVFSWGIRDLVFDFDDAKTALKASNHFKNNTVITVEVLVAEFDNKSDF
jgi:hypothetical protein